MMVWHLSPPPTPPLPPPAAAPTPSDGVPKGMTDPSVLLSFENYIANVVWKADRSFHFRKLRCYTHLKEFTKWRPYLPRPEEEEHVPVGSWYEIARRTGFTGLMDIDFGKVDHNLISAFVERWHPKTNNFHFPWGEITITLHDVAIILGLSIEGLEVHAPTGYSVDVCRELFDYMFGVDHDYVFPREPTWTSKLRKCRVFTSDFFATSSR